VRKKNFYFAIRFGLDGMELGQIEYLGSKIAIAKKI
jgi:hypothetical protein